MPTCLVHYMPLVEDADGTWYCARCTQKGMRMKYMTQAQSFANLAVGMAVLVVSFDHSNFDDGDPEGFQAVVGRVKDWHSVHFRNDVTLRVITTLGTAPLPDVVAEVIDPEEMNNMDRYMRACNDSKQEFYILEGTEPGTFILDMGMAGSTDCDVLILHR